MTKKAAAARREWVRQQMGEPISDGELITKYAAAFSMRDEAQAADEVKAILAAEREIEEDMADSSFARHIALGEKLMRDMLAAGALGPAAQMWKSISQAKGLEKQKLEVQLSPAPQADIVRERIAKLMQDQRVKEQARAAEIDLASMESETKSVLDVGDKFSPAHLLARAARPESNARDEAVPADPSPSSDAGPDNIVASYVAAVLPRDD